MRRRLNREKLGTSSQGEKSGKRREARNPAFVFPFPPPRKLRPTCRPVLPLLASSEVIAPSRYFFHSLVRPFSRSLAPHSLHIRSLSPSFARRFQVRTNASRTFLNHRTVAFPIPRVAPNRPPTYKSSVADTTIPTQFHWDAGDVATSPPLLFPHFQLFRKPILLLFSSAPAFIELFFELHAHLDEYFHDRRALVPKNGGQTLHQLHFFSNEILSQLKFSFEAHRLPREAPYEFRKCKFSVQAMYSFLFFIFCNFCKGITSPAARTKKRDKIDFLTYELLR